MQATNKHTCDTNKHTRDKNKHTYMSCSERTLDPPKKNDTWFTTAPTSSPLSSIDASEPASILFEVKSILTSVWFSKSNSPSLAAPQEPTCHPVQRHGQSTRTYAEQMLVGDSQSSISFPCRKMRPAQRRVLVSRVLFCSVPLALFCSILFCFN